MKKQTASKRKNKKAKMITGVVLAPLSVGIVATTNMQFEASADTVFIDIHNASELQAIKGNPKGSYRLVNDIDLTGVNWTPFDFQGVLDANGFKIKNLTLNHYGLFSTINNGVVKNLTIENFNITFNAGNVGALAGKTENSTIENVKVLNSKVKGTYEVGLLTGSTKNTTVKRVMAEGTVNGTADTGGLIGTSYANNTIENAYTNAIVNNSGDRTGGVVGYIKDTLVLKNVYSTSAVKGRNMVGGIVGSHDSTQYITGLTNVYALNSLVEGTGTAIGNIFGFSYRQITSTAIARDDIKGNSSNRYLKQLISQTDVENGLVGFEDSSIWKQDPVTKLPIFVEQENLPGEVPTYASRPTILKDDEGTFKPIYTITDLKNITLNNDNGIDRYKLMNDLDFEGVEWIPFELKTQFNGNGFTVKNLKLNYYGLFSTINNNGSVKNLTIENFNITSSSGTVGTLAGKTENATIENVKVLNSKVKGTYEVGLLTGSTKNTTVKRVMAEGTVNGTADTGGLIGTSYTNNTIENAYTNAIVNNSGDRTGGVVGYIKDNLALKNVYSTSAVKGKNMVGGIVGSHDSTLYLTGLTNVYALNSLVEGTGTAIGNIFGFSYRQITSTAIARDDIKGNSSNRYLKQLISQTDVENGLVGFEDSSIWKQDPVTKLPIFVEQENLPGEVPTYASLPTILKDDEGTFKPIYTIEDLKNITLNNDYRFDRYKLMNDLDFEGVEWIPFELKTQFNGNGFTVKNLKHNYYGLFSTINNNGSVKNLTIENFNITSSSGTVGTLAGKTENATIENVKVLNSKVKGTYDVGLLTGGMKNTTMKRVMAEGTVNGTADTGGLIGTSYTNNNIENAYTNAIVNNSGDRTGGVVGYIKDNLALKNVYSTSAVKGKNMVGGIVGSHDSTLYLTGLTNVYALNSLVEGTGTAIGNVFGFSYRQIAFTTVAREDIRGNGSNDFTKQLINQADVDNGLVGFEDPSIWKQDETTKLPIFVEQDEFPGDIPIYIGSKPVIPTPKEFKVTERGYNDLTLSWQGKNNELVEGFMITRDGQEIAQIPFDANTENHVYKDKNLTHGTSYDYEITVMYKGDLGKPSKLTESTLSVDKPTNVVLKKATDKSLSFTWDTVDIATEYIILRNDVEIARVTEPAFMDEGLKSSTSYKYKVITVSPYGNSQPTEITAQTTEMIDAIPTPDEFKITEHGYNDLTLGWQIKDNEMIEGFIITRDGQEIAQVPFEADTKNYVYKDKNLTHGTSYAYEITVMFKGDLGKPSKLTDSTLSVAKPTVVLKNATDQSLSFTWEPVDISTEYIILRNDVEIARVTEPNFIDEGLKPNTSYKYKVIAVSPYGNSQPSEITAKTSDKIDVPNPKIDATIKEKEVIVSWANFEEFYQKDISHYRVVIEKKNENGDFEQVDTPMELKGKSHTFNSLDPNTEYRITVTPQIDGDYNEDHAVSKVFTTLKVEEDMPTVLNVTATTSNKDVIVKWDAFEYKGVKSTRYRVQRYIKLEDGTFEKDGFARATTTNELVVTGLTAGNEYYFEVTPQVSNTYKDEFNGISNKISFELPPVDVVKPVTNVVASINEKTAEVTWDEYTIKGNTSTRYRVQVYEKDPTTGELVKKGAAVTVSENSYFYNKLEDGKTYQFMITPQANGTYNEAYSTISNEITFALQPVEVLPGEVVGPKITNVVASINEKTAEITWDEFTIKGNTSTRYRVQAYEKDIATGELVRKGTAVAVNGNSYAYNKLVEGKTYQFMITPQANGTYNESYSTLSNEVTYGVRATFDGTSVMLDWAEVADVTRYKVEKYKYNETLKKYELDGYGVSTEKNTHAFSDLEENTKYKFVIIPRLGYVYDTSSQMTTTMLKRNK